MRKFVVPVLSAIALIMAYVYAEERSCPGQNESCYTSRWR